jgi:hypothetical protein
MARPDKYPHDQWQSMTTPQMQATIHHSLFNALGRYLDTAPEGQEWERVNELLSKTQQYIQKEYDDPANDLDQNEAAQVMAALSAARERIDICLGMLKADRQLVHARGNREVQG